MLAQSQTEKFLTLLSNNPRSEFEKQPLKKKNSDTGFKPLSVADLVNKNPINQTCDDEVVFEEQHVRDEESVPRFKHETENLNGVDNITEKVDRVQSDELASPSLEPEQLSNKNNIDTLDEEKEKISLQAYDEGYAAGLAAAESASEGDVVESIRHLQNIIKSSETSDVFNKEYIKTFIVETIRAETTKTIGFCIEQLPEKFLESIHDKLEKFSYLTEKKTIQLNTEDYNLIKSYADFDEEGKFEFVASEKLDRGSILIEVGNIIFNN